jgi:hypothetical protein
LVVGGQIHQHADPPDPLGLLCQSDDRPRKTGTRAGDEFTPSH